MEIQHIKKRLPLIIAFVCGIFAIVLLNVYLQRREADVLEQMRQDQEQTKVEQQQAKKAQDEAQKVAQSAQKMGVALIAQKDIPAQTPITPADLMFKELPAKEIDPGAVTSLDQAIGQITGVAIAKEEQILKGKLLSPSQISKTLAEVTPEGKRAVTVTLDTASNMGLIKPGDYVDVFALIAPPAAGTQKKEERLFSISQNVKVLAVGGEVMGAASSLIKKDQASSGKGLVALAVSPQEAILFSFLQEHGKIRLILRSPEDTKIEIIHPADWNTLLQYISNSDTKAGAGKATTVEIYRGLVKEVVPLREN